MMASGKQKIAKPDSIIEYTRHMWNSVDLPRSRVPLFISIILNLILFAFIFFIINLFNGILFLETPVGGVLVVVLNAFLGILALAVLAYRVLLFISTKYTLKSSSFKIIETVVDTKPAKIVIQSGVLFRRREIIVASDLKSTDMVQGWLGTRFNYGNIILIYNNNKHSMIFSIKNPEKVQNTIQNMIDTTRGDQMVNPSAKEFRRNPDVYNKESSDQELS